MEVSGLSFISYPFSGASSICFCQKDLFSLIFLKMAYVSLCVFPFQVSLWLVLSSQRKANFFV